MSAIRTGIAYTASGRYPSGMQDLLVDLAASFRRHLRAANKAPRTCVVYGRAVDQFAAWLQTQGLQPVVGELTRDRIVTWLAELAERNAPGTVRTRYKGLHRFGGWLASEGEIDKNPMAGLPIPAVPDVPVPLITDEELTALLKACTGRTWYEIRDLAMIRVLLDTGCRVSELVGLRIEDVNLDHEMAFVVGKGSRPRPVYFSAKTVAALDRWLRKRREHRWAHLDALFVGERGRMTEDGVRKVIRYRGEQAGIAGLHPHRFRHTWAHDFLLSGGGERDLKRLAGWSSDLMLERYGSAAADLRAREATRRLRRGDRV